MIFVELNEFKAKEIAKIFEVENYKEIRIIEDMQKKPRILSCRID